MTNIDGQVLHARIRTDLFEAVKQREKTIADALRGLLHAVDNATAVSQDEVEDKDATEVPRRELTHEMILAIIAREAQERRDAVSYYESIGQPDAADDVRRELATFEKYLDN